MISTSIFSANGSIYDQEAVFGSTFQLNQTVLAEVGLPYLSGSSVWLNITNSLAVCIPVVSFVHPSRTELGLAGWRLVGPLCRLLGSGRERGIRSGALRDAARSSLEGECHFRVRGDPLLRFRSCLKAIQKYKEVPYWWYICLLVLSFVAGQLFNVLQ
jgi:hypothetical protein